MNAVRLDSTLTGAGWAWIGPDSLGETEFGIRSLAEKDPELASQVQSAFHGWLAVAARPEKPSPALNSFLALASIYGQIHFNLSASSISNQYAVRYYDAVQIFAHAMTDVLAKGGDANDGFAVAMAERHLLRRNCRYDG